ncbi:class I SAM-dependent methyltransferase [Halobacteriovorax sp. HLS]|uniref:class I SAM-dependent methyltransferase n=1 Tax=Halobacteriovorax sp. HLS TaxID=2234000 RepID=UPI000FD78D8D|nr:class I SAM-dependent methyltransferase [Halobacteriovorax sp. HLS]
MKSQILKNNELAINKWGNSPKFSKGKDLLFKDRIRLIYETKRFYIIRKIEKYLSETSKKSIRVLDFGSGHGGLSIDIKKYFQDRIEMHGYEVSPKAYAIACDHAKDYSQEVNFHLDEACNIREVFNDFKFDIIVSTDVFGHVPDLPNAFIELNDILIPGGEVHSFSETTTGNFLFIANYLANRGIELDESKEEHISLYPKKELEYLMKSAKFINVSSYGFDPIRFPFYPERYIKHLKKVNSPFLLLGYIFSIFSFGPLRKPTLIIFNFVNYLLAMTLGRLINTAGCFISAKKKVA